MALSLENGGSGGRVVMVVSPYAHRATARTDLRRNSDIWIQHAGNSMRGKEPKKGKRPYCCRSEARSIFNAIVAEWDLPQWHIASSNGRRDFPRGVTAYTIRGVVGRGSAAGFDAGVSFWR